MSELLSVAGECLHDRRSSPSSEDHLELVLLRFCDDLQGEDDCGLWELTWLAASRMGAEAGDPGPLS